MPFKAFSRFTAFITLSLTLLGGPALAEKADKDKPMNIEADNMRHDEAKKTSQFTGNVVAVKGTMVMRAARMEVQENDQGQQIAYFWAAPKERIFFRQKRDGLNEYTEGEAEMAIYDKQSDVMTLIQRAEARVLRGTEVSNQVTGQKIVYNNTTEVMSVDGQAKGLNPSGRTERVRAVLTPRKDGAAPAASSTPMLRTSPDLGESKKP
ncbi:lipopolysaccharide transport periplasmic protein LptA [Limnohabitans sp. Jir72]|uniref:lipopolysaccharide transport periplasmic protein LptA n=1 Tax=Limnohabitans sp. Jir72 TaxID=1977909 RepID=UPI000D3A8A34|nr:lipopolysaccharide transport periplasmic protein LptA [Limnohabitans sp. Jir72]PUE34420.1 lipopolysaccharide transport periplasmic protein LptA [Limnohabitans sp. Jir72]